MALTHHPAQQTGARAIRQDRLLPVGAEVRSEGGVHFRVWALQPQRVEVVLEGGPGHAPGAVPVVVALEPEGQGYFSGLVAEAGAGELREAEADVATLRAHLDDVTDSGSGEVAELLRPFYLDYLRKHGVTAP